MSRVALPREETRCDLEYFDGLLKLAGLYAPTSAGGHAGHHTAIDLGLTCPPAQRLRADPQRPTAPPSVNWGARFRARPKSRPQNTLGGANERHHVAHVAHVPYSPTVTRPPPNPVPVNNQGGGKRSCVSTGQARTTGGDGRVEVFLMGVGNLHHRKASTPAPATTRRSPLHPQLPKGRLIGVCQPIATRGAHRRPRDVPRRAGRRGPLRRRESWRRPPPPSPAVPLC
ncbi:Uncharacterised protein [Mycobacterium tuberculosis]|nr:Uncharacterised protein [Mycobacterium tuberculosis]SGC40808.1 Uncharacterised protein [Mycobacterium tuberculosis]SGC50121.1 Uncharacterised protein [Mycobacterium tuberculosis]SGE66671.1 Uncharacterised protein [Mycobacterium tuberculosis]SGF75543.1 Uncharacterised protein [Mycobacterium tuberculosis]